MKFTGEEYNLITIALMSYATNIALEAQDILELAEQGFTGDNSEKNFKQMAEKSQDTAKKATDLANQMMGMEITV